MVLKLCSLCVMAACVETTEPEHQASRTHGARIMPQGLHACAHGYETEQKKLRQRRIVLVVMSHRTQVSELQVPELQETNPAGQEPQLIKTYAYPAGQEPQLIKTICLRTNQYGA